jgi:hypothetical protein
MNNLNSRKILKPDRDLALQPRERLPPTPIGALGDAAIGSGGDTRGRSPATARAIGAYFVSADYVPPVPRADFWDFSPLRSDDTAHQPTQSNSQRGCFIKVMRNP